MAWVDSPPPADVMRVTVVGPLPMDDTELRTAIAATGADVLMFTALPPDRDLSGWAIPSGGVFAALKGSVGPRRWTRFQGRTADPEGRLQPWTHSDLRVDGVRWRFAEFTTRTEPVARWNEQRFDLPRLVRPDDYDRLLVLLDGPAQSRSAGGFTPGARVLLDDVQDVVKPIALALVVSDGGGLNEAFLPGGRFGELHVVAGNSGGVPGERVEPTGVGFSRPAELEPGFGALPDGAVDSGFWTLTLHGPNVDARYYDLNAPDAPAWRMVRDGTGWHAPD